MYTLYHRNPLSTNMCTLILAHLPWMRNITDADSDQNQSSLLTTVHAQASVGMVTRTSTAKSTLNFGPNSRQLPRM